MKTRIPDKSCLFRFDEKRDPVVEGLEGIKGREVHTLRNLCSLLEYPHSDRRCINTNLIHKNCPLAKGKKVKKS